MCGGGLHTHNVVKPTSTWLWLSWVLTKVQNIIVHIFSCEDSTNIIITWGKLVLKLIENESWSSDFEHETINNENEIICREKQDSNGNYEKENGKVFELPVHSDLHC